MVNTLRVEAGVLAGAILAAAVTLVAATPPKAMYEAALAREQAAREAMNDEGAGPSGPALLREIRAIENAYLTLVRRHPSSSYCDNALWNAAHLALDAFTRYGEPPDRDTGLHLLGLLVSEYPSSKLARQARDEVAQIGLPAATAGQVSAPSQHLARVRPEVPGTRAIATISKVERSVLPDSVRVEIAMDEEVPFHDERLENPPRVFVDFPGTRATTALVDKTLRFDSDNDVVKQIRIGRHENRTTRIVLDTAGVANYSIYALYDPYRLIIDCVRPNSASSRPQPVGPLPGRAATIPQIFKPPPALTATAVAGTSAHLLPGGTPQSTLELRIAREPGDTISAAPMTPPALTPPPAKNLGGFSMARQLGLNVSRIVIDPGHGGHDPGAQGRGVTEADVVLDVALRLEKLLQEVPGVEVILTRRTDDFIPLPERTAIANREGADLFLSIHANASQSASARGIETYFLNFASNLGAAAVAARENAASGQAMAALPDFVKAIALNNKLDESRDFASQVQRAMLDRLRGSHKMIKDLGVKQAPFVVLIGAAMPSVLAEISFVTNPQEAKLLKSGAFRQRIAEALLSGIRKYQTSLHNVTTIAHQGL